MMTPRQYLMAVTCLAVALTARAAVAEDGFPPMTARQDVPSVATEAASDVPVAEGAAPAEQTSPAAKALDLVLALDNSGSMRRTDPNGLMRPVVHELAHRLGSDARLGIVVFGDVVKLALPLTAVNAPDFSARLEAALKQLDYRGRRTEIPGGIERAVYELRLQGRPDADRALVFLTDGIVDVGDAARSRERAAWLRDTVAAEARDGGILVFGIGFSERADFSLIQAVSQSTGGDYRRIFDAAEIPVAFEQVQGRLAEIARKDAEAAQQRAEALERRADEERQRADAAREAEAARVEAASARTRAEAAERQAAETGQALAATKADLEAAARRVEVATERAEDATRGAEAARQDAADAKLEAATAKLRAEQKPPVIRKNQRIVQRFPIPMDWRPLVFGVSGLVVFAIVAVVALRGRRGARDAAMPAAKLRDLRGGAKGKTYKLKNGVIRIGRAKDNDIVLPYETVSAHHAIVEWQDGSFHVKDLATTNGTRRNGTLFSDRKEPRRIRVRHRDRLAFDAYEFEFVVGAAEHVGETVLSVPLPGAALRSAGEDVTRLKPQAKCAEHPSCDATQQCPTCQRVSCEWCITQKDGKVMCVVCAQQAA